MTHNPPSIRYLPGNPKPIGFQDDPSSDHVDRASDALQDLARAINAAEPKGQDLLELSVCLCSVRFAPGTPFELFGFHINEFDDQGGFLDPRREDGEVRFAVVVNHPTEAQVEVALGFLFELIERGTVVEKAKSSGDLTRIDLEAEAGDGRADAEFRDRMRFGWQEAAKRVAQLAGEAGHRLRIRYQRDVFASREEIVMRTPVLRRAYNELDSVRRAIDNTVSLVGGGHPHVRLPGAPAQARELVQAHLAIFGLRQFQNQTTRDAEVCGNGYALLSGSADIAPRCLRPENVVITSKGVYEEVVGGHRKPLEHVLHLRGLEQIDSRYGMSVLEPYLFAVHEVNIFRESKRLEEVVRKRDDIPEEVKLQAPQMIALAERRLAAIEERLTRLLGFTRDSLPQAKTDLYFPGQEDMH